MTGNELRVSTWNIAGDGQVSVDAVRVVPAGVVDDKDSTFYTGGTAWATNSTGLFGTSRTSSSTAGSGGSWAYWSVPVTPGTYDVSVTWTAGSNLSTAVPFGVWNGSTFLRKIMVNEQSAPTDCTDQGVGWKYLGPVQVTGNELRVSTWNISGDGQVCVDAIRVETASALLAAASLPAVSPVPLLQDDQLAPLVAEAEARWAAAGLDPAHLAVMKQVQIVVADLPEGYLGLTVGNRIYLDQDAAGYGWFVDPTPTLDEEFARLGGSNQLTAIDPRAVDRIDLLSVVEHELGHIAGLDDADASSGSIMGAELGTGVRRIL